MKNPGFPFRILPWLIIGLVASAVAIVGLFFDGPSIFLRAYLFSYLFWLECTLGCLAVVMVAYLTNGRWGQISRPILEAGAKTVWLMLILFLPIALGLTRLYVWAVPSDGEASPLLAHKAPYLNVPFFLIRAAFYFAVWISLTHVLPRLAGSVRRQIHLDRQPVLRGLSAAGVILYFLTMTFAAIDWIMSLTPDWYSTIFGMLVILGQALTAFSFVLLLLPGLAKNMPLAEVLQTRTVQDLAGLLLTCVMVWAYLAYSQLLIIWSGDLPEEVMWYYDRSDGGWLWVGTGVAVFQFALPFLLLLSTRLRQNPSRLAALGLLILVTRLVDNFWMVMPAFSPRQFSFHWLDLVLPVAIGGLWMAMFAWFIYRSSFYRLEPDVPPIHPHPKSPPTAPYGEQI